MKACVGETGELTVDEFDLWNAVRFRRMIGEAEQETRVTTLKAMWYAGDSPELAAELSSIDAVLHVEIEEIGTGSFVVETTSPVGFFF